METGFITGKQATKTVIGIVILALAITVFIQHRRIIALTRKPNDSYSRQELEKYKAQIKTLESRIADLQAKQNSPVVPTNNKNTASKVAAQETPAENRVADNSPLNDSPDFMNNPNMKKNLVRSISSRYEAFAEQNNLSEETKSKLYDLLAQMRMEVMHRFPRPGSQEMMDSETSRQQMEEINSAYSIKLSEVLSGEELNAFKEYQNSEPERMLLMGFNATAEDNKLDTEKENELITAMYNARQNDPDTRREDDTIIQGGPPFGRRPINERDNNEGKLSNIYVETAKNILSEDQMKEFKNYLSVRQSMLYRMPPPDRPEDMDQGSSF
jgi:hypothetical protein